MGKEKIRVLIADDEFIMRQGLRYMIAWEDEGFTIVGEAANGKDAFEQIEELAPQIVISDIVMPLMDGVDFAAAVHHRYPQIQMIILSGYDNFEYVKQTLMNGVVDYILKPTLTPHELLGVLKKAAERIPGVTFGATGAADAPTLLEALLLEGDMAGLSVLEETYAASYYCMYAATVAHGGGNAQETASLLYEKVLRVLGEFSGVRCCPMLLKKEQVCVLFGYEMTQRGMLRIKLEKLNGQLQLMAPDVTGIISTPFTQLKEAGTVYQKQLARGADLPFYCSEKALFVMENETVSAAEVRRFDFARYNRLLLGGQYRQAADQLLSYNSQLCAAHADVYRAKNQVKNMFMIFLDMVQMDNEKKVRLQNHFVRDIDNARDVQTYERMVADRLNEVAEVAGGQNTRDDARMDQILTYIDQHMTEELKLEDIGERFGLSYTYLSAYFNQQMNEGFNDYLNRVRINRACTLLGDLSVPVAQVSALVGYSGHSYFCRVFKKYTGKTPSEYRRERLEK